MRDRERCHQLYHKATQQPPRGGHTHLVWAWHRALITTDLPPPVGPTTMVVWRVNMVSYIWTTLSTCGTKHVAGLKTLYF